MTFGVSKSRFEVVEGGACEIYCLQFFLSAFFLYTCRYPPTKRGAFRIRRFGLSTRTRLYMVPWWEGGPEGYFVTLVRAEFLLPFI